LSQTASVPGFDLQFGISGKRSLSIDEYQIEKIPLRSKLAQEARLRI
jgi:hypothetical protein